MNSPAMKTAMAAALGAALLALGAAAGDWWAGQRDGHDPDAASAAAPASASAPAAERKVLYWYDPMVPTQKFDRPGKTPFLDRELVPR